MFSKRVIYSTSRKYDRAFFVKLLDDLKTAGFTNVTVKVPYGEDLAPESDLDPKTFLDRNRNYPSTILVAENPSSNDLIKVLFVNLRTKVYFNDDTFPSGYSEPPEIYVQTSDPARLEGLIEFFQGYFGKPVTFTSLASVLLILPAIFYVFAELLTFFEKHRFIFQASKSQYVWIDIALVIISGMVIFGFYRRERGLYIKEREHRWLDYILRALKGDFKDNPIISTVLTFLATFLAGLALKGLEMLVGWLQGQ